jgi:hypothetical protein
VKALSRKVGLLVAGTAAFCGMTVLVPATASAATSGAGAAPAPSSDSWAPRRCTPAHWGPSWRWHDTRWGGHWDHRVWNRRHTYRVWVHEWRDNHYCAPRRDDRGDGNRWDGNRPQNDRGRNG